MAKFNSLTVESSDLELDTEVTYRIAYWITEEDREDGYAEEDEFNNLEEALREAEHLYNEYACVEIYDEDEDMIYHRCSEEWEGFLNYRKGMKYPFGEPSSENEV